MSAEENNKSETAEAAADKKDSGFVKGETFAEYVVRKHGLQKDGNEDEVLNGVCEETTFSDFMGYLKWKSEEPSILGKAHMLTPMLRQFWLPENKQVYSLAVDNNGNEQALSFERQEAISFDTEIILGEQQFGFSKLDFLNSFFIPHAINHLEKQILNGEGGSYKLTGLLKKEPMAATGDNLKDACLSAIEMFCRESGKWPSALFMSFQQRLHLMKILSKETPEILTMIQGGSLCCFAGVPIVPSDFIPLGSIMLINLDDVFLILKDGGGVLSMRRGSSQQPVRLTYCCNVVIKDQKSVMVMSVPNSAGEAAAK